MSCWIRGCTTRNGKNASGEKISRFRPFTDEMFDNWGKSGIADKGTKEFTQNIYICELHFKNEDVVKEDVFNMTDGQSVTVPRNRSCLRKNAVPCIFPTVPKLKEKLLYCHVFKPIADFSSINVNDKKTASENLNGSLEICDDNKSQSENSKSHQVQEDNCPQFNSSNESLLEIDTWIVIQKELEKATPLFGVWHSFIASTWVMLTLYEDGDKSRAICAQRVKIDKNDMRAIVYIGETEIDALGEKIENFEDVKNLLWKLRDVYPCMEVQTKNRSKTCEMYFIRDSLVCGARRKRCIPCAKYRKSYILKKLNRPTIFEKLTDINQHLCDNCENI